MARDAPHNPMRCVTAQAWAICGVAFLANSPAIGLRTAPCSSSQPALLPFAAGYAEHPERFLALIDLIED